MGSIFKLTSAEFKKIFKRPSIFVMAVLLVITILSSLAIFNPTAITDPTITYDMATNSSDYYDSFYDENKINSKKEFDDTLNKTDKVIRYYKSLNDNTIKLTNYYNEVISCGEKLSTENNTEIRHSLRKEFTTHLGNFLEAYKSLESLAEFPELTELALTKPTYIGYTGNSSYYLSQGCTGVSSLYEDCKNESKTDTEIVNTYNVEGNKYKEHLKSTLNSGTNFVYTSIKGAAIEFNSFYSSYSDSVISGYSKIDKIQESCKNMTLCLTNLKNYLDTLMKSEFPVIVMSNDDYHDLNNKLTEALDILDLSEYEMGIRDNYVNVKHSLELLNIRGLLDSLTQAETSTDNTRISQVHLDISVVSDMEILQTTKNNNSNDILNNIKELKGDESISNISTAVTNYSLLSSTYSTIINDIVISSIASKYNKDTYSNLYGYEFKDFNTYQYNERITTNRYYLNNNKYSNSFASNFSFAQDSTIKTNAYDYMYFTLELCTVVIMVFAMMLVCSLITGETESGTIKLLLVRPYKRSKIITSKLLATIFFVITFMLFTSILTFVGGYFVYGLSSTPVLAVINATTAFEISPLLLMIINIITLTLDILFFVYLALMISILFKNYPASITCVLVLLIVNFALNILFGGTFWYTLLPGMNLHLFKYFGNTFVSMGAGSGIAGAIQSVLITGIHSSMSLLFSSFLYAIYSLVFLAVAYSVFQKRDF
ncbi:MAG: hypothetical protein E7356_00060 [Clostridiales bacterium]|nr:hypothetical protein [Clostridiales bacterium]